jgi:hypothetical protein
LVLRTAATLQLDWSVDLVDNPDRVLDSSCEVVATSDSVILDGCARWFNLARYTIEARCPGAVVVDLSG